ncbi:hypothetical protein N0B44_06435 [Roseibacterium beibuensis]|uniref:hypothetical protein n=1 Tax=[Roseibacterium] beibuensis TaxID=1193142 RepID=UPI00217E251B|nr:hypothetical protein [Roseibacterium beibuensis]MCS6622539.1 hypothetical protein [Roseibacterium beibuensis]
MTKTANSKRRVRLLGGCACAAILWSSAAAAAGEPRPYLEVVAKDARWTEGEATSTARPYYSEPQTAPGPAPAPVQPALTPPVILPEAVRSPASPDQPQTPTLRPQARDFTITLPLKDGTTYLGDVEVTLGADGSVAINTGQFLASLEKAVSAEQLAQIRANLGAAETVSPQQVAAAGQNVVYDSSALELRLEVPAESRERRVLTVADLDRDIVGTVARPSAYSGYMNFRTALDYVVEGVEEGVSDPVVLMDGAVRFGGVVLELDAAYDSSRPGDAFTRDRTRLVYDDVGNTLRWAGGDLRPDTRGFQGGIDIAGLSVERLYRELEPQRNVRPRGERGFTLQRAATVETIINGRTVQRTRLQPGVYDVRDFPFIDGSNDVTIVIDDGTGLAERLDFSLFFDREQLSPGLAEFGLYGGVGSDLLNGRLEYSDAAAFSGFYRVGVSESLTLGANGQYLDGSSLIGGSAIWGSPVGNLGADVAFSHNDATGDSGWAVNLGLERLFQAADGDAQTLTATLSYHSDDFASVGALSAFNPFSFEGVASWSRNVGERLFVGADARYAVGRGAQEDISSLRASVGYRIAETTNIVVDVQQDWGGPVEGTSFRIGLTRRFGQTSSGRIDYDSRSEAIRAGYQSSRGRGVGASSVNADIEYLAERIALNGALNYTANRADTGVALSTAYDMDQSRIADQRASVRVAGSVSFADGQFAVGRPIFDSFVILKPHSTLGDARIVVDPSPEGDLARSGPLGPAVLSEISSYSVRTLTYDVPTAPPGYDIGEGSERVLPPYRSGYLVEVGSDYFVLAIGRLVDAEGAPVALVAGQAREVGSDREPVVLFTSRDGRFSAQGLREGRWRIELGGSSPFVYDLVVPPDAGTLFRTGDLRPVSGANQP